MSLRYDSLTADPRPIVHFGYKDLLPETNAQKLLIAKLSVQGQGFNATVPGYAGAKYGLTGGEHFWSVPNVTTPSRIDASLQVDLRNQPTGKYEYTLERSIQEFNPNSPQFGPLSAPEKGDVVVVNRINSSFGSGWSLSGWQEIVKNSDGSVLLLDGDGSQIMFEAPTSGGGAYISPHEDFSKLEKLSDGTWRRTLKDKTVYTFNALNKLSTVRDRNGNTTRYLYNTSGQLSQIVDPVGLTTTFGYTGNKVTSITDPAGRITSLSYDAGNLTQITDPDGQKRTWEYDTAHHMKAEVDQRGDREQSDYDDSGRATQATHADGSIVKITPAQVKGLYTAAQTSDPFNAPVVFQPGDSEALNPKAIYTNGNNNIVRTRLDSEGHAVNVFDAVGDLGSVERDEHGLIRQTKNGRGQATTYTYDERGNVETITDSISGASVRSITYDPVFNSITSMKDELGHQTLYQIDPKNGNVLTMTQVMGAVGGTDDLVTSYTYLSNGLIDTITNPLGQVTDFDYNSLGRLTTTTFAKGTVDAAVQSYEYDAAGNQTAFIDEKGNRTSFSYDALNRLKTVTEPDPDGTGPITAGVTSYEYDAAGNQKKITDARNSVTSFEYDALDHLVKVIQADPDGIGPMTAPVTSYEYDAAGNLTTMTDPLNRLTQYRYDSRERLKEVIDPSGANTQYLYDLDNNLTTIIDPLGHQTNRVYDARNRLTSTTDPLGYKTSYEYDAVNNLMTFTNAKNYKTTYKYDELDRLTERTDAKASIFTTGYDANSNITTTIDELGHTTSYKYDKRNRPTETTDAAGGKIVSAYDANGNLTSITDQKGQKTQWEYDALDRITKETDPLNHTTSYAYNKLGSLTAITDGLGQTTRYNYDALNQQTSATDALGKTATTSYDAVGNVISFTDELGRTSRYTYNSRDLIKTQSDPLGNTTTNTYDANRNVWSVTDALGHSKSYTYDALNRPLTITDALNATTVLSYDPVGNLQDVTDPVGNITRYTYDGLNQLLTDTNQLNAIRSYTYDAAGNMMTATDRNGKKRSFLYDALDRQTTEKWLDASGNNTLRTISYDPVSQLKTASDPDSTLGFGYDAAGNMTSASNTATGVPSVVFGMGYDAADNRTTVTDTINGQLRGTTVLKYDAKNRLTRITQTGTGVASKRVDIEYDAANQLTNLTRSSDALGTSVVATSGYSYDAGGRLMNLSHKRGTTTLAAYSYGYDAANRMTQMTSGDGTSVYTYDHADQLTGVDYSYQADEAYSYDANGNRTNTGYGVGANNRLLSDGKNNFEYDAEGNLVKQTQIATGNVTQYTWDYRQRLTGVVTKNASGTVIKSASYTYDALDRRIAKVVDADGAGPNAPTSERFVYDSDNIAFAFNGSGTQTDRYLYGPYVDQVLVNEKATNNLLWTLPDHQGTVRDLANSTGAVQNHIRYGSFGNITSQTNAAVTTRYGYTGRELDNESGNYNYRARYLRPATGRFLSPDPIGFDAGDANLYRYVGNSPTNFVDPSGLRTEIYIHAGHNWYGHTAINVDGTVYTFGRYAGTQPKDNTGGTKGEGYFYMVKENYYLNSKQFTDSADEVYRYSIKLTPQEEKQIRKYFENIYDNNTKPGTNTISINEKATEPDAQGRIVKDDYNFLSNNCNTTTLNALPRRVKEELIEFNDLLTAPSNFPFSSGIAPVSQGLPFISPPNLKGLLDLASLGSQSFTKIPTIPKGVRKY